MTPKDPLFEPLQLGGLTLKNRIMSTSHAIAYQEDGKPKERYQAYHEEKARGGLALTMFGGSSNIDLDSASVFGQLYVGDDSIVPWFKQFASRIHQYDTALMCQITHLGRRSSDRGDWWLPTIGPSRSRERLHRAFCKQMDNADIARVQQAYADAAARCRDGDLDGIELMAGSHLPGQFLSPLTNQRDDGYGGDLAGRSRFLLETLRAIRTRVGGDFIIGLRLPCEEEQGGIGFEESCAVAEQLCDEGLVDFLNVYFGRMDAEHSLADNHLCGMATASSPFLDYAGQFKKRVKAPVFHATRVSDVASARHAIREGLVDMIAMTRAHIADPYLVEKIRNGEEDRIRPCVGATLCSTDYRVCIHNAATGAEQVLPQQVERSTTPGKRAIVVGGGPAGMEAARVLALRGHKITLLEAQPGLGGQIRLAAKIPWRADMIGISDWLAAEVVHLGVEVRCNVYAEADEVLSENPDIVVIATGGLPDMQGIDGIEHALSSWDVLEGNIPAGERILVFDETGRQAGSGVADLLATQGKQVQLISVDDRFGRELTETDQIAQRRRFAELGIEVHNDLDLVKVERDANQVTAHFIHFLTGQAASLSADAVIVERGTEPNDELFTELCVQSANNGVTDIDTWVEGNAQPAPNGEGFMLYRVGDAISSRGIHEAIRDSLRLCARL